jgi:hypothetical protein
MPRWLLLPALVLAVQFPAAAQQDEIPQSVVADTDYPVLRGGIAGDVGCSLRLGGRVVGTCSQRKRSE